MTAPIDTLPDNIFHIEGLLRQTIPPPENIRRAVEVLKLDWKTNLTDDEWDDVLDVAMSLDMDN